MTSSPTDTSPAEALFRQGIDLSRQGRSDEAIAAWSQAVKLAPVFPHAHHLLGAELAHVQRYGDAVVHLTLAADQAPELLAARVQLALLWLTLQSAAQAQAAALPLLSLPEDSAYRHFGLALTALCTGDQAAAVQSLKDAQARAVDNAPLAADMNLLLQALSQAAGTVVSGEPRKAPGEVDHQAAISLYAGRRT
jgi:tetratricopeptide (TPR) repeat protein